VTDAKGRVPINDREAARLFRALGDPTRLRILRCLFERPRSVGDLASDLGVEDYHVSRHLAVLRAVDLVEAERDAQRVIYRVHDEARERIDASTHQLDLGCCQIRFPD
jgi:DNA-binding transcriptional ArsR family regulator